MQMTNFDAQLWGEALETHFREVHQHKMQGLPILNERLQVRLVSLKEVRNGIYLGAIISPWFLNLVLKMIQPIENSSENSTETTWQDRHQQQFPNAGVGNKISLKFPSGTYEFIVNHQPQLGYFYTCAFISDMHTLESQAFAEETAEQCVHLVFDSAAKEPNLFRPQTDEPTENIPPPSDTEQNTTEAKTTTKESQNLAQTPKSPAPHPSRRDFLRLKSKNHG